MRDLKRHGILQVSWGWIGGAFLGASVLSRPGVSWEVLQGFREESIAGGKGKDE
jgi:hypothetical protein